MTNRYGIVHKGRRIAFAYLSPHPEMSGHIVVSVVPLARKGKWQDNSLELRFENPLHDIFPDTTSETEAIEEVISQAAIEPFKVEIHPLDGWYNRV